MMNALLFILIIGASLVGLGVLMIAYLEGRFDPPHKRQVVEYYYPLPASKPTASSGFHPASNRGNMNEVAAKVAEKIRWRSECVNPDDIRPISHRDGDTMKATRAVGLAIWQERESFVTFFSSQDKSFDADVFRDSCKAI
jgi:hypothetical protein